MKAGLVQFPDWVVCGIRTVAGPTATVVAVEPAAEVVVVAPAAGLVVAVAAAPDFDPEVPVPLLAAELGDDPDAGGSL